MSNEKYYPLHPNATHPPVMTCEIPLEEYESLKRENAELKRMDTEHTVHIAKMNARIAQLEDDVAFWKAKTKGEM